jgi:hypothetical protein
MRVIRRSFLVFSVSALLCAPLAYSQDDSPSLGDAARQAKLQKQQKDAQAKSAQAKDGQDKNASAPSGQSKDAPGKDSNPKDAATPKTPHVITNDEIPEHVGPTTPQSGYQTPAAYYAQPSSGNVAGAADQWKQAIQGQKGAIASLQSQINSLNDSIKYAPGNCVSGCVQWNERQKQKQDQVEAMKSQLEEMQKRLEDMQEACRKQGFGSSVYDP